MKSQVFSAEALAASAEKAWQTALLEAVHSPADVVPVNWLTRQEVQAHWKLRKSQTRDRLSSMIRAGKVTTKKFRVFKGNRIMPTPHYKLL